MGRTMLHGVLNMPAEIWHKDSPIDDIQRQSRYAEASKLIFKQDDIIAELEKDKEILTQHYDMWKGQWHELNNRMPIHNLEQQAKGVEGYIARRKLAGGSYCSTTLMYIDELYEQAKALKEQE